MVSMQIGFPGETYETFRETWDFVEEIQPDFLRPQIWFCDPTTPVWRKREEFKLEGKGYSWSHYSMDAETAVDLTVEIFMGLKGNVWVPDPGYNWVATYAMEKVGMPMDRQKDFLRHFSAAAKQKLLFPSQDHIQPDVLENLKGIAKFDQPCQSHPSALRMYSGESYVEAQKFWINEFSSCKGTKSESTARKTKRPGSQPVSWTRRHSEYAQLNGASESTLVEFILANYRIWLHELYDENQIPIVMTLDAGQPFPLALSIDKAQSLKSLLSVTIDKLASSAVHRLYAFYLLTNPFRMKEHRLYCPDFECAFMLSDGNAPENSFKHRMRNQPNVHDKVNILLQVAVDKSQDRIEFSLASPSGKYSAEAIQLFRESLSVTIESASRCADIEEYLANQRQESEVGA